MRICLFFSTEFPYETTLQNELPLLANEFDRIYYFPTSIKDTNKGLTKLPENITLEPILAKNKTSAKKVPFKFHKKAAKIYLNEMLKRGNFMSYLSHFRQFYTILVRNLQWAELLEDFINNKKLENVVVYDYWFENVTIAIAELKKKNIVNKAFTRAHRFDLYDESWGKNGKVPFREFKIKHIDKVFTVAQHGQKYFQNQVPAELREKIHLAYLGLGKQHKLAPEPKANNHLIISVSNTRNFKRVHEIPSVLKALDAKVKWIHFGNGPMDNEVKKAMKMLPSYIEAEFRGFVPNKEIFDFLVSEPVSVFLSLSLSEGLPISMMESLSFGIPIFACNVCGIPELINEFTGSLFEPEDSILVISEKLKSQLEKPVNREQIHNYAAEKFDYEDNFRMFIKSALK